MRYAKDRKEETRRRIVASAARTFRRDGIVASGVVGLMKEIGLTQGGFYAHFASKDALVEEAMAHAMADTRRSFSRVAAEARAAGTSPLEAMIDGYLSEAHLDNRAGGCAFAAVGPELARQCEATRRTAARGHADLASVLATELPAAQAGRAGPLFALMCGTLQLARLAGTRADARAILADGRAAARLVAGL